MSSSETNNNNILITGAAGQLGVELTTRLIELHGVDKVIATDIREPAHCETTGTQNGIAEQAGSVRFEYLDVLDYQSLSEVINRHDIDTVYHLAAILSAKGEQQIEATWNLNINGLLNVLELGRTGQIDHIFWPSSIAVFGPDAPRTATPQNAPLNPTTVYGISKVAGEQWCSYYFRRFGVDVRSLRYPGLIGWISEPGGGTTDYAVDMLRSAYHGNFFECPLNTDTHLPMMIMDDAVKAALDLMSVDTNDVGIRTSYNVTSMHFSPRQLGEAIRQHNKEFQIEYKPDARDEIARSWPDSIDDQPARTDWGWKPSFDLEAMVRGFFEQKFAR